MKKKEKRQIEPIRSSHKSSIFFGKNTKGERMMAPNHWRCFGSFWNYARLYAMEMETHSFGVSIICCKYLAMDFGN